MRVGHGVVPPEEPGGDKVSHQDVDAVVLVPHQDAEHARSAEQPADPLVPAHPARRICSGLRLDHAGLRRCAGGAFWPTHTL